MKILYSHRTRSADGQYVHISALTHALKQHGVGLCICGPDEQDGDRKKLSVEGGRTGALAAMPGGLYELAELGYSVVGHQRLSRAAQHFAPDVLYERYNIYYHAGQWLARRRGLPFILEVNAPLADERASNNELALGLIGRWSERSIWRAADAVLPVTNVLAERVMAAGVAPEKITVIQNGVDASFLSDPYGDHIRAEFGLEGRLVLGFTGFVRAWHGVGRILDYMVQAGRDDLHLLLVGDGPVRDDLQRQAAALGLADRLTITGVRQREEIPGFVAAFDIALQPAVVPYASPLKLFEYMGLGRAIIAPDSANIREVLRHGEDSYLFDSASDRSFIVALDQLVRDAPLRQRLGGAARQSLLRQKLTWDENAARVERIAVRLLEQRHG